MQETERLFIDEVRVLRFALHQHSAFYKTPSTTFAEARARVLYLKDVIENQDGYRVFYRRGKVITQETQLHIFYLLRGSIRLRMSIVRSTTVVARSTSRSRRARSIGPSLSSSWPATRS